MLEELRRRYSCRFYRLFPWQNAIEAEHLFFVVCDVMFLHAVKGVSFAQFSFLISFSLLFSVIVQYPLLKCIHAVGTRRSVQLGSLFFLLSALCFTFAPNYWVIMAGGIAKCIRKRWKKKKWCCLSIRRCPRSRWKTLKTSVVSISYCPLERARERNSRSKQRKNLID